MEREEKIGEDIKNVLSVSHVSCGEKHTLFLVDDLLYGIGDNSNHQLGNTDNVIYNPVLLYENVTDFSCGRMFSMFKTSSGIFFVGSNYYGPCGMDVEVVVTPLLLPNSQNATSFSCGSDHVVMARGKDIYSSGYNLFGQLGIEGGFVERKFRKLDIELRDAKIVCNRDCNFAFNSEKVYAWGSNLFNQLGNERQLILLPELVVEGIGISRVITTRGQTVIFTSTGIYHSSHNSFIRLGNIRCKSSRR